MRTASFVVALALAAGASFAAPILEVESNNTLATANVLTPAQDAAFLASNSFVFDGRITSGNNTTAFIPADVDFVSFNIPTDAYFTASLFGIPNSSVGDSVLVLYSLGTSGWTVVTGDDDNGLGAFSSLEATISAGTYALGIAMFPDASPTGNFLQPLDGLNGQQQPIVGDSFNYKLVVGYNPTTIPTPGALALVGAGALVATRRRR